MSNDPSVAPDDFVIEVQASDVDVSQIPLPEFLLQRDERIAPTKAIQPQLEGLIGERSVRRFLASVWDLLLVVVVSLVSVAVLPEFDGIGLFLFMFYLLYFQITECMGATPAKWWLGLQIRSIDGSRATVGQIAIRTICRLIETNPFFLCFLPAGFLILFTRRHVRLGDWLAGTVVVRVEDLN